MIHKILRLSAELAAVELAFRETLSLEQLDERPDFSGR
jgi:hypothetical protein